MLKQLVVLLGLLVLTGCTSVVSRVFSEPYCNESLCRSEPYHPYLGTVVDANFISGCVFSEENYCRMQQVSDYFIIVPYGLIDIPFSLLLDTLLLPVDSYFWGTTE